MISTVQSSHLDRDESTVHNSKSASYRRKRKNSPEHCSTGTHYRRTCTWPLAWVPLVSSLKSKISLLLKICLFQGLEEDKDYNPHCEKTSINIKLSLLILILFFLDCLMYISVVKSMARWAVRDLQAPANHPWLYQGLYDNIWNSLPGVLNCI